MHEKANRSDAHQTLELERAVLLFANQDWNKEVNLHFGIQPIFDIIMIK